MSIIRFKTNPVSADPFNNFFEDFFGADFINNRNQSMKRNSFPAANIYQNENSYVIELSAPGLRKDDFNIEIDKEVLNVKCELKKENTKEDLNYNLREFRNQSFSRSFQLPENSDFEKITAEYIDGVLKLEIPKVEEKEAEKPKRISVQ